jgi:Ser/Thr protein kinase RdoA (MazF antagonist)
MNGRDGCEPMTSAPEIPLPGRTTSRVVRVADTVRRPIGMNGAFVHHVLRSLAAHGFRAAPRFLGIDHAGREMLSLFPGEVPRELGVFSDEQLFAAARLLRRLHDATVDSGLTDGRDVVCHGDASPCNCVFVDGLPAAFIDFDAARPGRRRDDVGYAAWLWLELGEGAHEPAYQGRRLAEFFLAYGALDDADPVSAVLDAQSELANRRDTPAETRRWAERCRDWTVQHRAQLKDAVRAAGIAG